MRFIKKFIDYIKHHKKRIIAVVVVLAVIAFIFRPKPSAPIPTQTINKGDISQTVSATGTVVATKSVNLIFQVPGLVSYVGVKKGDFVNAYQTIATIDQREALKNLQNNLLSYSKQRNDFEQGKSDNGVSGPDQALNDTMKRILQNNQFDLDKAVLSVELQDLARQKSILTTPIAGIVSRADIETPGIVAAPTATYTVVDPDSVVFNMDVDEADVAKIMASQNVTVTLDAYPDEELDLTVSNIDFVSHNTSTGGTAYTVEAELGGNNDYRYRVGMSGNGEILIRQKRDVVIASLISLFNDNHVYVKTKKGFEDRKVVLGLQNDTDAEVLKGLEVGDIVALQPNLVPKKK